MLSSQPVTQPLKPTTRTSTVGRTTNPVRYWLGRLLIYTALLFFALLFIVPFVWLVSNSLKTAEQAFDANWIPRPIMWSNYVRIFQEVPLLLMARNSVIVAVLGVLAVVLSSSMIAYGLARLRFPGAGLVFAAVLGTMMMPGAVTMIPGYLIWKKLNLVNTLYPLWLGNLFGSSFYIFMLRQFLLTLPQEIIDAGRVDGASYYRIYWQLMLPLIRPALLSVTIFEFQAKWNDFMGPLIYIQNPDLRTLPLGLQIFVQHLGYGQFRWELLFAASVLVTLPMVLLFAVAQKQFIEGIATTGIKG
ncbi:MAG: carbohydrate ABC transporter permease [Chloroflexi bacterium]|nr:carbohydrate ABC transporter permease [Chloroflexota bacterium]